MSILKMEKPNVNDCEYIAVPSTWITKYHYKNQEELNECYNKFMSEGGNCVGESFRLFLKLRNVNAVRCRGNINNLKILKASNNNEKYDNIHYWVEANGKVFDKNHFRTLIIPKKDFYNMYQIDNVEVAENGIFTHNNYILQAGSDKRKYLNQYLIPNVVLETY